jgi:acetyl-CoA carboxylase biotin carboxylase subunit
MDTAIEAGSEISCHYDSLIAKLIVRGPTRDEALARMRRSLEECVVEGIKTTIPLHLRILDDPDFQKGRFSTAFLERFGAITPGNST